MNIKMEENNIKKLKKDLKQTIAYNTAILGYLQIVENFIKIEKYDKAEKLLIDIKKNIYENFKKQIGN